MLRSQQQTTYKRIALAGIPYSLNYRSSDRMPGHVVAKQFELPVIGKQALPPSLLGIEVQTEVAGQKHIQKITPPGSFNATVEFQSTRSQT